MGIGSFLFGPMGIGAQGETLNDMGSVSDIAGLQKAFKAAQAAKNPPASAFSMSPLPFMPQTAGPVAAAMRPMSTMAPPATMQPPQVPTAPAVPSPASPAAPSIPLPQARPGGAIATARMGLPAFDPNGSLSPKNANSVYDDFKASPAGQRMFAASAGMDQPSQGFFQNNTAMMRDPSTGQFIDPAAAAKASQMSDTTGPQLIQKFMNHFGNSTPGTNPNGSIAGASGPTSVGGAPLVAPMPQQQPQNQGLIGRAMTDFNSIKGLFS